MSKSTSTSPIPSTTNLQTRFLELVPRIETHARIAFRDIRCQAQRADCVAETVAIAWKWFVKLAHAGQDAREFGSAIATYAARSVRAGRRVAGMAKARDAFSRGVESLAGDAILEEALVDNTATPVPDQVGFRMDFPRWRKRRSQRDRRVMDRLMIGECTQTVARTFGISEARVSQLRREFMDDWEAFVG